MKNFVAFCQIKFYVNLNIPYIVVIYLNSIVFPRNIQPKATQSMRTDVTSAFGNIVTSIPKSSPAIQQQSYLSQRFRENGQSLLNSNNQLDQPNANKLQIGRQGQIKDVQSIIANFRQTHPEIVPRRGRRLKNVNQSMYLNDNTGGDNEALLADILSKRNNDMNSPPSSNDSSYSNSQMLISKAGPSNQYGSIAAGEMDKKMQNKIYSCFLILCGFLLYRFQTSNQRTQYVSSHAC